MLPVFLRQLSLSIVCIFLQLHSANAQLMGTKNIPGDYGTLALAIDDLNTQGTGPGGVILILLQAIHKQHQQEDMLLQPPPAHWQIRSSFVEMGIQLLQTMP